MVLLILIILYHKIVKLIGGGVWYEMETEWANALKELPPKKVSVSIEPIYSNNSMRPDSFMVEYEIEGQFPAIHEIANKSGG